ncbi:hypothetical protein [Xenorhabdus entomophaga]|uniref:hypothetical protein n=1 Tax=Xenorhabdus entomophaga TaxID=3136257 RepID=UPI0030F38CA6
MNNNNDDTDNDGSAHLTVKLPAELNRFLISDAKDSLRTKKNQALYALNWYMECCKLKQNGGNDSD